MRLDPRSEYCGCFPRFPMEICPMILDFLPTRDALSLHLVSWTFYALVSDISFWQPRFTPEGEAGYLFEARDGEIYRNLDSLLMLYRFSRQDNTAKERVNRQRVWILALRLLPVIQIPLMRNISSPHIDELHSGDKVALHSKMRKAGFSDENPTTQIPRYPTTTAEIQIPSGTVKVGIAVITTGIWDYVTGIRVLSDDGTSQFAGYVIDRNEKVYSLTEICGFRVAMGPYRVRAIQVVGPKQQACHRVGRTEGVPISDCLVASSAITSLRVTVDVSGASSF